MIEKDVCYITTDALEPVYLKGQIVSIKEPDSEWSEIERGNKIPENSDIRYAIKKLFIDENKLDPSVKRNNRLVLTEEDGEEVVTVILKYTPPEVY